MAVDRVAVEFEVDPGGQGDQRLINKRKLLDEIRIAADKIGAPLSKLQMAELKNLGIPALQQFKQKLGEVETQANRTAQAVQKIDPSRAPTGTGIGGLQGASPADRVLQRRFDQAGRQISEESGERGLQRAVRTREAFEGAGRAINKIENSLFAVAGIPQSNLVEGLLEIGGVSGGLTVAALAAIGVATQLITGEMRKMSELALKLAEQGAAVKTTGLTGNTSQISEDLRKLEQLRQDVATFAAAGQSGRAIGLIESELGKGASPFVLDQRLQQVRRQFAEIQTVQQQRGQTNIFDSARDSLKGLAEEVGRGNEVLPFINDLRRQLAEGKIGVDEFDTSIKKFGDSLRQTAERQKSFEDFKAAGRAAAELEKQAEAALRKLTPERNPYKKLFDDAKEAMADFASKFNDLPQAVEQARSKIQGKLASEFLRQSFGDVQSQASLEFERQKLREGLAGSDLRAQRASADQERQRLVSEIERARLEGDSDRLRELQFQFEKPGQGLTTQQRLESEFRQRELEIAQRFLQQATEPEDQRFFLDQILNLTNGIAGLTPDLEQARLKALEQKLQLGQKQQEVKILIQNEVPELARTKIEDLGPRPGGVGI